MNHEYRLGTGNHVECRVTGLKGVITSASTHLNGCDRYFVQPSIGKGSAVPDGYWIDDMDLSINKKKTKIENEEESEKSEFKHRLSGGMMSTIK
jgi:hypothetical protein